MLPLHRRLLAGGAALAAASAALVAVTSSTPATADTDTLAVPGRPGQASVTWDGTAPFNNGQSGLVWG